MENILICSSLTKIYKQGDNSIYAVNNCSLKIKNGSFTVIIGPSGSGKSTLLHLLAAIDQPTSGEVYVDGKDIYKLNDKDLSRFRNLDIGFIFQTFHLLPILTAEENILMPALISGKQISKSYLTELCEYLNISARLNHLPNELSGGEQQRVAIARAMINHPKIIFADEPTGNLDKKSANEIVSLIAESSKKFNQTILMVTHDLNIMNVADTVYEMDDGNIKNIK